MRQKKTKQLYGYWMDLFWNAGNLAGSSMPPVWPQRSDVHPSACRSLLGDMFILAVGTEKLTYRLAGTRLCALYGHELKGREFSDTFGGLDRDAATRWAARAGTENYIAVMSSKAYDSASNRIDLETLLMPVACNSKRANRVLGLTVACDAPVTLGNRAIDNQTIRSVRTLRPWINADAHRPGVDLEPVQFETPRGLRSVISPEDTPPINSPVHSAVPGDPVAPRHVAHLRVYDGGKVEF